MTFSHSWSRCTRRNTSTDVDERSLSCSSKVRSSPSASLLGLPAELRFFILKYALAQTDFFYGEGVILVTCGQSESWRKDEVYGKSSLSQLLRINRQLHDEVEELFYSSAKFAFRDYVNEQSLRERFLSRISPKAKSFIRHIKIYFSLLTPFRPYHVTGLPRDQGALRWYEVSQCLVTELPGIRTVSMNLDLPGPEIETAFEGQMVNRIVSLASVFRNVGGVDLVYTGRHGPKDRSSQSMRMIEMAQERIRRKEWREFDES